MRHGLPIAVEHLEAVTVQVHGVPPRRLVANIKNTASPAHYLEERRHTGAAVSGHGLTVHCPGCPTTHAHHAHAAHHAPLKSYLMGYGCCEVWARQGVAWQ